MDGVNLRASAQVNALTVHDFVKDLRINKLFTSKQSLVIENLYIYFEDLKVYKVIIAIHPSMMKKAKKLGFNELYTTVFLDDVKIKVDEIDVSIGKYICIYNLSTQDCAIYHGEESEEEQRRKIKKRPTYNF